MEGMRERESGGKGAEEGKGRAGGGGRGRGGEREEGMTTGSIGLPRARPRCRGEVYRCGALKMDVEGRSCPDSPRK